MTAQKGKDLLLKIDPAAARNFVTVAGLRAHSLSFNAEPVDITAADSANGWRQLLAGAGLKTASVSGAGIFRDGTADATLRSAFFNGKIHNWQIVIPDFGIIEGLFQITTLEYAGRYDGELNYELALQSAGTLSFTAL